MRYSEPLGARYLDEQGAEQLIWMGSYGIGPARVVAAAVEQGADEHGIAWPRALAPFDVELVTLGKEGEQARTIADGLYDELREAGLDVIYDDRTASAGEKFADAELLGCPLRLTVGKRSVEAGELEVQVRRGASSAPSRSRERPRRWPRCGASSPDHAAAARARPVRRPAARDAARAATATRGRSRTRSASCGSRWSRFSSWSR